MLKGRVPTIKCICLELSRVIIFCIISLHSNNEHGKCREKEERKGKGGGEEERLEGRKG